MAFMIRLRHLWLDRRGNFVLIFALLLLPLIGLIGLAVDFALLNRCKTELDAANDAAVLAATTAASETIQTETNATSKAEQVAADATTAGQNTYNSVFAANAARVRGVSITPEAPDVVVNGLAVTVTGVYTAQSPNIFGGIFGVSASNVAGTSTSSVALLPKYTNIYVAFDDSQSEGIGTTALDMKNLQILTKAFPDGINKSTGKVTGCQFGCHVPVSGAGFPTTSYEEIAHTNIIKLRIDSIRDAIVNIVTAAQTAGGNGDPPINLALYSMDETLNPLKSALGTISFGTLSSNYQAMLDAIFVTPAQLLAGTTGQIDLESNIVNGTGPGDSYQVPVLTQLAAKIPANGNGNSAATPVNYVFIMTDGVTDKYDVTQTDHHRVTYLPADACAAFKGKAIVDVIYTEYLPMLDRDEYNDLVKPFAGQIATNMKDCAQMGDSPPDQPGVGGQYILATSGPEITKAAQILFAQAIANERLTR